MNARHEHNPRSWDYCDRLLQGQFVLVEGERRTGGTRHYVRYAAAHYTRNVPCPGTGPVE